MSTKITDARSNNVKLSNYPHRATVDEAAVMLKDFALFVEVQAVKRKKR